MEESPLIGKCLNVGRTRADLSDSGTRVRVPLPFRARGCGMNRVRRRVTPRERSCCPHPFSTRRQVGTRLKVSLLSARDQLAAHILLFVSVRTIGDTLSSRDGATDSTRGPTARARPPHRPRLSPVAFGHGIQACHCPGTSRRARFGRGLLPLVEATGLSCSREKISPAGGRRPQGVGHGSATGE